jgi:hypothetical protein
MHPIDARFSLSTAEAVPPASAEKMIKSSDRGHQIKLQLWFANFLPRKVFARPPTAADSASSIPSLRR